MVIPITPVCNIVATRKPQGVIASVATKAIVSGTTTEVFDTDIRIASGLAGIALRELQVCDQASSDGVVECGIGPIATVQIIRSRATIQDVVTVIAVKAVIAAKPVQVVI